MSYKFDVIFFMFFASIIISLSPYASASSCETLYKEEKFDEAIPLCIKEKKYFRLGLIYGDKSDCANMKKYYGMSSGANASGNLGLNLLRGSRGCEKDIPEAIKLIEEGILLGNPGFGNFLGNYYKQEGNTSLAKKYYKVSYELETKSIHSDWMINRAKESFSELTKILDYDEKKQFYLESIELSDSVYEWRKEIADQAFLDLKGILSTSEKLDLFFKFLIDGKKYKCEIGRHLYATNFNGFLVELQKQNKKDRFSQGLGNCEGKKEYFLALTFENGLGNKEDLLEAYRLYLIAGSKGNVNAKSARDRIRENLSAEQISQATCLADYGIEPGIMRKWICSW